MPVFVFTKADTIEETVDELINRLMWLTARFDSANVNRLDTSVTDLNNADGDSIVNEFGNIYADFIVGDIVAAQSLYAKNGYISTLVVDELLTEDKVQKFLMSSTSDIDYIHINDQFTDYRTATYTSVAETGTTTTSVVISDHGLSTGNTVYNVTRGASRTITVVDSDTFTVASVTSQTIGDVIIQHSESKEGNLLYWTDTTHLLTTTEATDYPVYIYIYNDLLKMQVGFISVDGTQTPVITLGAGTGTSDYGKGFIYKGTDGLEEIYKSTVDGSIRKQIHTDDDVNHVIGTEVAKNVFSQTTAPTDVAKGSVFNKTNDFTLEDVQVFEDTGTVVVGDGRNVDVDASDGTFTLTLYSLATELAKSQLDSGELYLLIRNVSGTEVTIAASGTETITEAGSTGSLSLLAYEWVHLWGFGTNWEAKVI